MAGRSKVKDLPPEIRAELDRLLREDRCTLDQVVAHLRQLAPDVQDLPSRSAIGRYAANVSAISERLKRSREIVDRLSTDLGPQIADGRGFQVLMEGFQSLAFDMLANVGEGETLDAQNLSYLAKAIGEVARANKTDTDRILKLRQEAAKEAAAAVDKVAERTPAGLTRETVEAIKAEILGISR